MIKEKKLSSITKSNQINSFISHFLLLMGVGITVFPFVWMFFTSFKGLGEALRIPPTILPEELNFGAYVNIGEFLPIGKIYLNTIISTMVTVVGQVIICTMAAYAFARINFFGKNVLFLLLLSVLMLPAQIFLIPKYLIIQNLGLLDTLTALFLPNLFSVFGTFLLRQFFMTLPRELEDAALLDGCNRFQTFRRIMVPLVHSGIAALVIFTAKFAWNDFMWPLIANTSPDKMILGPALSTLQGQYLSNYPLQMAGAVITVLPMIIIFFICQKSFIEGASHTGVKG